MSLLRKPLAANSSIFNPSEAATIAMIPSSSHRVLLQRSSSSSLRTATSVGLFCKKRRLFV